MGDATPLRLLLVEDSESDAALLELELRRAGYAPIIERVENAGAFRGALCSRPWDLVIADYNLPAFTGLEALQIYKTSGIDVPFFLVSGTIGESVAVEAMHAGAHDYLLKDHLARLGPAIARELRESRLRGERRRDLARLVASERRFNAIFQSSPVAIVVTAFEDGTIHDINPAALDLLGYSREEVVGQYAADFGAWTDMAERRTMIGHALAQGGAYSFERDLHTKSGEVVTVLTSFSLIDIEGAHRLVVTMQDITARKHAEETLRESEERFRLLVENSTDLIVEVGRDGTVYYASPNHTTLTGRPPDELAGTALLEHVHPDEQAVVARRLREGNATGLYRYKFSDGSWHWIESSGRIFRSSTGDERMVIVARDVSERMAADEARKRLEDQLRQAQKLDALGTLAGGIAHDFNNILTAIMAYTDMATLEIDTAPVARQHLAEVRRASERARDLVRQILAFSRQREHERKPVRLQVVVREVLKLLRSTLPSTIAIQAHIADDAPVVLADPTQIHQVVMNLGTNAAHALRDRTGTLTVRLELFRADAALIRTMADLQPGNYARLVVADNGHGMDSETLKRIFEPFFTTKPPGEGTGLGLAVVHGIVRDHEGAIAAESRPNEGTSFSLYFPEHAVERTEIDAQPAEVPAGRGERVLFVDDEQPICAIATKILGRLGYHVTTHHDPIEALGDFTARPTEFDLVVTDLTMPRLTGIDLARCVIDARPRMPVLLMSGFSATWTSESVRAVGIIDLIAKPLSLPTLAHAVRRALDARASASPSHARP